MNWGDQPMHAPTSQPPPKSRRWLVIGSVAGVAVIVAAGGGAYFALRSDDPVSNAAVASNVLRGEFPDAPSAAWTVTKEDVARYAGATFGSNAEMGFAIDGGDVLVMSVGSQLDENYPTFLVGLDAASGEIRWATETNHQSYSCAQEVVDGLLLCEGRKNGPDTTELRMYDVSDGKLVDTAPVEFLGNLEVDQGAVYTSGWNPATRKGWIAKGTPADLKTDWRAEYDFGSCAEPTLGGFLFVRDGLIELESIVVDARDGRRLSPENTAASVVSSTAIAATPCEFEHDDGGHEVRLLDRRGAEMATVEPEIDSPAADLTPGSDRPVVIGNTAYDRSGAELWSTGDGDALVWLDGDVALGFAGDTTIVGYSASSGDRLWEAAISPIAVSVFDSERMITTDTADKDHLVAYDLATGEEAWSIDADAGTTIGRAGDGFVAIGVDSMSYFTAGG